MIMDMQQRLYPVGRQDFAEIRTAGNFMYIDKTEYVYRMTCEIHLPEPAQEVRQVAPRIHAEILFPGQEGTVPRTGY